jgi:hypothetical protein
MDLLNKLSKAAFTTTVAFFTLVTFNAENARAALFKFSFTSKEANGYIVYDDSIPAFSDRPGLAAYLNAAVEYKIDLGNKGVFQGSTGTPIIFLPREEYTPELPENDGFELEVRSPDREPESQFTFLSYFYYPKDSFVGSTELPTTVPNTARLEVYPNVNFPIARGEPAFIGDVQTRIERVPESTSTFGLLGASIWCFLMATNRFQNKRTTTST